MTGHTNERRAAPRWTLTDVPWLCSSRLRPGHDVSLLNLSRGGALVEVGTRLLPGTRAMLQLCGPSVRLLVSARVVRCHVVSLLGEQGVRYRGALAFDEELAVAGTAAVAGYDLPAALEPSGLPDGHALPKDGSDPAGGELG